MRISDWSSDVCSSELPDSPTTPKLSFSATSKLTPSTALTVSAPWPKATWRSRTPIMGPAVDVIIGHPRPRRGPGPGSAEIGRASCRERVCQYRLDLGGRGILYKKTTLHPTYKY